VKFANVFKRGDRVVVRTLSRTTAGVLIGAGKAFVLTGEVSNEVLGESVQQSLAASTEGLPHPSPAEWPGVNRRFLTVVGAKSMTAFMKGARCVGVAENAKTIAFEPTRNEGAKAGFIEAGERRFEIPAGSKAEEVGKAAQKALQLAE
jgi:hypothetical protein